MATQAGATRAEETQSKPSAGNSGELPLRLEAVASEETEEEARWKPVLGLLCELVVDLPLPGFKISDLLKVRAGSVINAHWQLGREVPLRLNGTLIGWSEFEVVGNKLAVRLTELD